ncbi:MAG: hypothetical protein NT070_06265 [Cyanobacteria bacterium]|nr:hypothetical protein [Cyanobacteriota bacterium]
MPSEGCKLAKPYFRLSLLIDSELRIQFIENGVPAKVEMSGGAIGLNVRG